MLHVGLNKPEFSLTNSDIKGSQPMQNKFVTTRQPSNPLNPSYKLANFTYVPPEPIPYKRNQMEIDDIDGARPTK